MKPERVALITTTINVPHVLQQYVADWNSFGTDKDSTLDVIVAGDVNTDPKAQAFVDSIGGTYIAHDSPLATRWRSNDEIGTRSIQRRNIALLYAISLGADVIVTIDDDNTPSSDYFKRIFAELEPGPRRVLESDTGWFNPGEALYPSTVSRGFPLSERHTNPNYTYETTDVAVGVLNGLTTGDPDVDAIERIVNRPNALDVRLDTNVALASGTWAPFNTQNTAFVAELAPLMQVLVGVGRYDDIFSSYIARVIMDATDWVVSYGFPSTYSMRNEHDLLVDMEKEWLGYRTQHELITSLRQVAGELSETTDKLDIVGTLMEVYAHIAPLLPMRTVDANEAWIDDVIIAQEEGERIRG